MQTIAAQVAHWANEWLGGEWERERERERKALAVQSGGQTEESFNGDKYWEKSQKGPTLKYSCARSPTERDCKLKSLYLAYYDSLSLGFADTDSRWVSECVEVKKTLLFILSVWTLPFFRAFRFWSQFFNIILERKIIRQRGAGFFVVKKLKWSDCWKWTHRRHPIGRHLRNKRVDQAGTSNKAKKSTKKRKMSL